MTCASLARALLMLTLALAPLAAPSPAQPSEEWERLIDLRGPWRFDIGDAPDRAEPEYDDGNWEALFVPARWEDEGFFGYDGVAWYRKRVVIPADLAGRALFLHLGRIDDIDEVYVNGLFVGRTGTWAPHYQTAYHVYRIYQLPADVLRFGEENVIAVRVYDHGLEGGILEGRIGIYENRALPRFALDLAGRWQMQPGDDPAWRNTYGDKTAWTTVTVPATWEPQGFDGYDGYAWYRKRFWVPEDIDPDDLVLMLGKIDDLDETFLNGRPIGHTGAIDEARVEGHEWQIVRAYPVPPGLLRPGAYNTLAVRVYDGMIDGGIFEGPIGLVTRREAARWMERTPPPPDAPSSTKGFWRWLWDRIDAPDGYHRRY
ncbi:hypothetical protein AWN76_018075 [Rhodothermaceae bacterium RA]|nr:hypothetical protein AWN76_018075 [Rhodothermaceae bacterium RA]